MTEPAAAEKTPLEERLIALIKANGPITVADYMEDALGHPHDGYYSTETAIGADGDFTTAPEISQIFGELIGAWLVQSYLDMGEPKKFNLIEFGPGRGVMMADILRAASLRPQFLNAAEIWLVEKSGRLRHEQRRRLERLAAPRWTDDFHEIPPAPSLVVANEFFDCLPIRQFDRLAAGWRERLVGLSPDGTSLAFCTAPTPPLASLPLPQEAAPGAVFEFSEAAERLVADLAAMLIREGGRALIIDYGHFGGGLGDTLQAVRRHAYWQPLAAAGKADITAHVDFEALSRAAINAGAAVWGPVAQGVLLDRLGLAARAQRLSAGKSPTQVLEIERAIRRLAAPEEMGEVFKALAICAPNLPRPAGFDPP
ncbi:MAG: SAM-dependent methyltransferase [Parvularculaceae bacterium]|jgi:NADH dehydrogenase [ubiquinone] 1 alpha subcomplex assembly factor 7|nr:SAM-dependent methyltransferase [Parvularculaceae bacterium]